MKKEKEKSVIVEDLVKKADHSQEEIEQAGEELLNNLSEIHPEEIVEKKMTAYDAKLVTERLAKSKDVDIATAQRAMAEIFRKGGANAGAKDTMSVEVVCKNPDEVTDISRYDITMAMLSVVKHKNVRKLAEVMAPMMLQANLNKIKRSPTLNLQGDLANKINRNLMVKQAETPEGSTPPPLLTREEAVCCCTYAQWMPNLDELANSTRLKSLMEEDLLKRKVRKKGINKPKAQPAKVDNKDQKVKKDKKDSSIKKHK